jgi:hypothetical protein
LANLQGSAASTFTIDAPERYRNCSEISVPSNRPCVNRVRTSSFFGRAPHHF